MRFLTKIILMLIVVFFLSALLLPFVEQFINLSGLIVSDLRFLSKYGAVRIFSRLIMLFAFCGFFVFRKEMGFVDYKELGYGVHKNIIHCFYGFGLSVFSFLCLMSCLIVSGHYYISIDPVNMYMAKVLVKSFFAAGLIAFLEETLFRGYLFKTFTKTKSFVFSLLIVNVLYSMVHFLTPENIIYSNSDIFYGFDLCRGIFTSIGNDIDLYIQPFIGLLILGSLFTFAYIRTGSLYLSLGLHAGFVFAVKADFLFIDNTKKAIAPFLYDKTYISGGVLSWIVLIVLFFVIGYFTKNKNINEDE